MSKEENVEEVKVGGEDGGIVSGDCRRHRNSGGVEEELVFLHSTSSSRVGAALKTTTNNGARSAPNVSAAVKRASELFAERRIDKKEYQSIIAADALFRFEETVRGCSPKRISRSASAPLVPVRELGVAMPGRQRSHESVSEVHPPAAAEVRPPAAAAAVDSSSPPSSASSWWRRGGNRGFGGVKSIFSFGNDSRDSRLGNKTKVWSSLLGHGNLRLRDKVVRQLCWDGIPPAFRARAWSELIGNDLRITPELYAIFAAQSGEIWRRLAAEAEAVEANSSSEPRQAKSVAAGSKEGSMALLVQDLPRTFPQLAFFHERADGKGEMAESFCELLRTYVCYRPDVGYIQGMSYLSGVLLLNMENTYQAFTCFANLINQHFCFDMYRLGSQASRRHFAVFERLFSEHLPLLYNHFRENEVRPEQFLLEWSLTLYSKALPLDIATRIWDCYLLDGEVFGFRVALGLLRMYGSRLARVDIEGILGFLSHLPQDLCGDKLFENIDAFKISQQRFQELLDIEGKGGDSERAGISSLHTGCRQV
jgi:hypothetical protein